MLDLWVSQCFTTHMDPIQRAIEIAGGPSALAERLGVSKEFVSQLGRGVRPVPPTRCRDIEEAVNGEVTRFELRPDVFGEPASAPAAPAAEEVPCP